MAFDASTIVIEISIVLISIGIHEFAHAKMADAAGDPTPRLQGRVTLNILKHLDPIGTVMIVMSTLAGFGIGWGKPVYMDDRKMRNPRWDHFAAVAAGPISNLLQAAFYAIIFRLIFLFQGNGRSGAITLYEFGGPILLKILLFGILINLSLCFFNLIPLGPLDGHWLVGLLMPEKQRFYWYQFNRQYGGFLLLALVIMGQSGNSSVIQMMIMPPVERLFRFMTGIPI